MISGAASSTVGANGLLFSPYIVGERAPYADADIRGSFLGIDATQDRNDFARAVIEGVTFSFRDILNIYQEQMLILMKLFRLAEVRRVICGFKFKPIFSTHPLKIWLMNKVQAWELLHDCSRWFRLVSRL